ncbi:hypothetical protein JM946_24090 [Steroidobacter sp. S1-65]|uniref:MFS transporter n=1 Tax=Steroidobacter gossypii TaxID=2805490 RepID=A0ABS1X3P2_9GAMM|nr:DUF5690 family protein [Steroidobacter gossypii]MBM0107827.1 hypothetical protein [Steroidobacter gossypii]
MSRPQRLSQLRLLGFTLYATSAAFLTYFSMYAFRKTFAVASFEHVDGWWHDVDFKTAIVIAQVIGYALSKFIGIKVISEMAHARRAAAIVALVMCSQVALVLFAVMPASWKPVALFLNGLPLGMIWGLVFSFLEGRRVSEVLGAGLSVSFVLSSGVVKSVGKWLVIERGVSELWMPAVTGFLFTPLLLLGVYLLSKVPAPSAADRRERNERVPMTADDRKRFFLRYMPGLVALILVYMLLTGMRDFSDNFSAEIWAGLGFGDTPSVFSTTALWTSILVLIPLAMVMFVRDNLRALLTNHALVLFGIVVLGFSTLMFEHDYLGSETWMILHSTGIYLAYIPFNCLLFDRMIAAVNDKANAGFLIYLADSMGYAGSVGILLYKQFLDVELSWVRFMIQSSWLLSILGVLLVAYSAWYFQQHLSSRAGRRELPVAS